MPADSSTVLITGGTGSMGQALTRFLLATTTATIRIYSRSELLQAQMCQAFPSDRLRFFLGDVRDLARLHTAMVNVETVFHAAALKHIDAGQYNPLEFKKTNIDGTENVMSACQTMGVRRAVLISTDKAVYSKNVYGNSKAMAEQIWACGNAYKPDGTVFAAIRYGNVRASRGSAIEIWRKALTDGKPLPITDHRMTRFDISIAEAVHLAWFAAQHAPRGSILIPHLPAYSVKALAQAVVAESDVPWETVQWQDIGIRPGEKLYETLLTDEEAASTVIYSEAGGQSPYYCIPPVSPSWRMPPVDAWQPLLPRRGEWQVEPLCEPYRSDTWTWRLSVEELRARLKEGA